MICYFSKKEHTDTLVEQTETKPQEMPEFKMYKQTETYSFDPPLNFSVEGKSLLAVTSFDTRNSVFKKTDENKSF